MTTDQKRQAHNNLLIRLHKLNSEVSEVLSQLSDNDQPEPQGPTTLSEQEKFRLHQMGRVDLSQREDTSPEVSDHAVPTEPEFEVVCISYNGIAKRICVSELQTAYAIANTWADLEMLKGTVYNLRPTIIKVTINGKQWYEYNI